MIHGITKLQDDGACVTVYNLLSCHTNCGFVYGYMYILVLCFLFCFLCPAKFCRLVLSVISL